ncbi:MAG: ATP-binding protein [Desulfurococcaceae archaeon TW002]
MLVPVTGGRSVLFDLAPKTSRKDLYDFVEELENLYRNYVNARLVTIVGPRRAGKTSLILTFLNEYKIPHIFVDCRTVSLSEYGVSFRSFAESLSSAINMFLSRHRSLTNKLLSFLREVKGVEIDMSVARISLRWKRKERFSVTALLEKLNTFARDENMRLALVFDELQELSSLNLDFSKLLAYTYDHLRNLVVYVSGSQVGLLYDMLGIENPDSPLYGRLVSEVKVRRLTRSESIDFLERGFSEAGVVISRYVIEDVVEKLDGLIGWLTFFGWSYVNGVRNLEEVVSAASKQEAEEVKRFLLRTRSEKRFKTILKLVSQRPMRWSELKKALEFEEGIEIDDHNFNALLQRLVKAGLIEKRDEHYAVPDPILATAIRKYI